MRDYIVDGRDWMTMMMERKRKGRRGGRREKGCKEVEKEGRTVLDGG